MKDTLTDANFPRTADHRVYHLGIRVGEVANRIVTVGPPSRANSLAKHLDPNPKPFALTSERGFLTITGRFQGVPVSIVTTGMGYPNMDFFVREVRESLEGEMVVVRLGSCGALIDVPVGTVVLPSSAVAVRRDYDFDFTAESPEGDAYFISKPVNADPELCKCLQAAFELEPSPIGKSVIANTRNASADSFYSSQGRQTSFPDHNEHLIERLLSSVEGIATLEMETFHLLHLAASWRPRPKRSNPDPTLPEASGTLSAPPTTAPVEPQLSSTASLQDAPTHLSMTGARIRAAAAHIVYAARLSQAFITPQEVQAQEEWAGLAVLRAIASFPIEPTALHEEKGSVWEQLGVVA